jgi:branched-chain amino acid transport system permease protein
LEASQQEFLQHLLNGVTLGSIYALIALGYTMVYGILQLINFAHSEVYMMGAFAAYYTGRSLNLDQSPGILSFIILLVAAIVACSVLGLTIERFAYRPLRKAPKLNILITAIGVSLLLQYSAQIIFGAEPKLFPEVLAEVEVRTLDITIFLVGTLAMGGLHFLIHHTRLGMAMRAVSVNGPVASLMGINVDRIIMWTFVVGSSLAAVGSVLVGLKYPKIDPLMGMLIGIKAFVAAVLGGIGSLPGAMLGGIFLGLSEEMVVAYLSSTYRDALAFGILIVVLLFRPAGLMGTPVREKV